MIRALLFLNVTSLRNRVTQMLRRLKQPRYLAGFVVGLAYFYFFFLRHMFGASLGPQHSTRAAGVSLGLPGEGSEWLLLLEPAAALVILVIVLSAWILPRSREALAFTEAEIAFLFPAPVSRTTLIHYKLLKSQFGILLSSLLLGFFSQRFRMLGGSLVYHMAGWWLAFSTLNLHFMASSFTIERLLGLGLRRWLRQTLAVLVTLLLVAGTWYWLARYAPAPQPGQEYEMLPWLKAFFSAAPLCWVLVPFRLVVRPFLAGDLLQFLSTVWPAILILVAHYFWVIRTQIAFEEASLAQAQKRAIRVAAVRSGGSLMTPKKPRREPFLLRSRGNAPLAFLWKGMIETGTWTYPRNALLLVAVVSALLSFLCRNTSLVVARQVAGTVALTMSGWLILFGPMIMRMNQVMERLDVIKSFPLRGWQIVLGELLMPVYRLCIIEWLLLLSAAILFVPTKKTPEILSLLMGSGVAAPAILAAPLMALMLCIPMAATLYFPAWMSAFSTRGGGVDVMGQRIIFSFAYLLVLVVAVLPACLLGAIPYAIIFFITHSHLPALLAASVAAALALIGELAAIIWWLGKRYEAFDLSQEMPR